MRKLSEWIKAFFALVTFKPFRDRREALKRRLRYEEIRSLIVAQHLEGKGGLILPKKYDVKDLQSFRAPMYYCARSNNNEICIFWHKDFMSEEVGPPRAEQTAKSDECH